LYRYPINRIVAILDDDEQLRAVLDELPEAGVDPSSVNVLSGPEGAERLDRSGVRHGLRGRVLRLLQRTAYEGAALDAHEAALKEGRRVIYVPVGTDAQRDTVVRLLWAAGGHYLLHFHRWTVEEIRS